MRSRRSFFKRLAKAAVAVVVAPFVAKAIVPSTAKWLVTVCGTTNGLDGTYVCNQIGIYQQLRNCGKVLDPAPLNLKSLLDDLYKVERLLKGWGYAC